jgi:hypothetical protein
VLRITRRPFCAAGYLSVLSRAQGSLPAEMLGFCDKAEWSWGAEGTITEELEEQLPAEGVV